MYREKSDKWFIGVINNENTRAWRDEPLPTDSADFDPDFLQIDREKRRKFFIERSEQPKQLELSDNSIKLPMLLLSVSI